MDNLVFLPQIFEGIKFGNIETDTVISFEGKYADEEKFPKLGDTYLVAVRYGKYDNQPFLAIDRHSSFAYSICKAKERDPTCEIVCNVYKNGNQTRGKVIRQIEPHKLPEWDLGLVIIALENAI